jgi:hypothetical protein
MFYDRKNIQQRYCPETGPDSGFLPEFFDLGSISGPLRESGNCEPEGRDPVNGFNERGEAEIPFTPEVVRF